MAVAFKYLHEGGVNISMRQVHTGVSYLGVLMSPSSNRHECYSPCHDLWFAFVALPVFGNSEIHFILIHVPNISAMQLVIIQQNFI